MISTAPIVKKKKEDNNLLKGQRTFITLQYDAENEIQQGQLSSFWLHRVIKRVFRKEREQVRRFLLGAQKRVRNYATNCSACGWKMTEVTSDTQENS